MGLRKHFAGKWDFRSRVPFSQPISQLRNGVGRLRNGTRVPKGCFAAAKHPAKWGFGCEIPAQLCTVHLQTTITFSFQIQITYRLKHWNPDFIKFKTRYSMQNLSSRKCSKMCPTVAKCNISVHGVHNHLQTAITSSFQLQIEHRLKLWTPDFPSFETRYGMNKMNFGK